MRGSRHFDLSPSGISLSHSAMRFEASARKKAPAAGLNSPEFLGSSRALAGAQGALTPYSALTRTRWLTLSVFFVVYRAAQWPPAPRPTSATRSSLLRRRIQFTTAEMSFTASPELTAGGAFESDESSAAGFVD